MTDHEELKTGRGEILIVDDTPANLQLLTDILVGQGYVVRATSSGRLALRSVAAKAPHLIVLDVKMSEMDGFEVCRRLKADEHSREIPVIFISALEETVDRVRGFEVGGVDYISKPFQPEEVLARIGVQLRIRQLTDKLREANETLEARVEQRTADLAKANADLEAEIAERLKAQKALQESEKLFRSFFKTSSAGMAIIEAGGVLREVNQALCSYLGYSREEMIGRTVESITHPDDRDTTDLYFSDLQAEEWPAKAIEKRYLRKDGAVVWGHASAAPVFDKAHRLDYYVALVQDITNRKEAEEAVRESERKHATLLSNLPGMAYRCRNDRDWTMEFVSEGARALTGYAPEDLIANRKRSFSDLIHPEDREWIWQYVQSSVKEGQPFELEYRIRTSAGEERWVWERGRGIFGPDGKLLALEGFLVDSTERKEAERDLAFREAFEGLVAGISSRFVALPASETDSGINAALRDLGVFADVDRSYVFLFDADLAETSNSHEWCAPGIEPQIENLQRLPVENIPWFFDKISRNEVVYVPRVKDLPAEAGAERAHWEEQFIRSVAVVPMVSAGRLIGFFGFDAVTSEKAWSEQDLALLRTVGEIIGSALVRQRAEKEREQLLHDMGERIKELRGLYSISQLLRQDISLDVLFQQAVNLIPPSWQYPEITRAKLLFDDLEYVSAPFEETPWKQAAEIIVQGQCRGALEVYYLEERPTLDEGPFLQEERQLLDTLSRNLGETIERKRAQEALRESEDRFRSIFVATTTPMGILSVDGDFLQINRAACSFFGYTEEECSMLNVLDVTDPADRAMTSALYEEIHAGQRKGGVYEKCYLCKDGTPRWGHTTVAPVTDEQGQVKYFVVMTQDITDRKRAEEALKRSEERLSLALQVSNEGVWDWNLGTDEVYFSPRYFIMLGYEPDGFPPTFETFIKMLHPDDRERTVALAREQVEKGGSFQMEFRMVSRQGNPVHILSRGEAVAFDSAGRPTRMVGTHMDITARKQAERALQDALATAEEAREKIDAILKSVADGLVVADLNHRVVLMNRAAEKLAGMTLGEALSRPIHTLFGHKGFHDQIAAVLAGRESAMPVEWELKGDEGARERTLSIQAHTAVVQSREGQRTGTITILRDVTRERELDRMKNEFISTAAHELRTPLTSVLGFSEILLKQQEYGITDPVKQQELLSCIHEKAGRLETIVSDLLNLSRIESGQMISLHRSPCDIVRLLDRFVSHYRQGENGLRFELSLPEEAIELQADAGKLEQVLENLLSNAIKFSPQAGTIRVSGRLAGDSFHVVVADEGIGMTAEQVERVFDKFYRVDASDTAAEGLGLGMSIAKSIVEAHGGEIEVESEPGQGTTVRFSIPLEFIGS